MVNFSMIEQGKASTPQQLVNDKRAVCSVPMMLLCNTRGQSLKHQLFFFIFLKQMQSLTAAFHRLFYTACPRSRLKGQRLLRVTQWLLCLYAKSPPTVCPNVKNQSV